MESASPTPGHTRSDSNVKEKIGVFERSAKEAESGSASAASSPRSTRPRLVRKESIGTQRLRHLMDDDEDRPEIVVLSPLVITEEVVHFSKPTSAASSSSSADTPGDLVTAKKKIAEMEQEVEMMRRQQEEAERQFKMQADKLIELLKKEREEKGALFQRKPSDADEPSGGEDSASAHDGTGANSSPLFPSAQQHTQGHGSKSILKLGGMSSLALGSSFSRPRSGSSSKVTSPSLALRPAKSSRSPRTTGTRHPLSPRRNRAVPVEAWSDQKLDDFLEQYQLHRLKTVYYGSKSDGADLVVFQKHATKKNVLCIREAPKDMLLDLLCLPYDSPLRQVFFWEEFANVFLMSFKGFMTASDLLRELKTRFNAVKPSLDGYDLRVQLAILTVFEFWSQVDQGHDFIDDDSLKTETLAFLESVTCSEFNRNVIHIRYLLNKSYAVTFLTEHPPPLVPWYISSNIPSKERYDVIDVNVTELARQMTLIESAKFNRIHRDEFLNGAWYAKVDKEKKAPNLLKMIDHANEITRWVTTEILKHPSITARANIISHFIGVMVALEQIHNYNGVIQVLSSLHTSTISKLKQSWELVPRDKRAFFDRMTALMSNLGHYKAYHDQLYALPDETPCIPLISVICQDLFTIQDGNPDFSQTADRKDWLNWDKFSLVTARIEDLKRFHPSHFNFAPVYQIQDLIEDAEKWSDEDICYEIAAIRDKFPDAETTHLSYGTTDTLLGTNRTLTERDWKIILTGSTTLSYEEKQVILDMNMQNTYLWKIKSGVAQVVRHVNGEYYPVGEIGEGSVFGEVSVLQPGELTTAAIVAKTQVVVDQIRPEVIAEVCQAEPEISANLQLFLARKLAERLREMSPESLQKSEMQPLTHIKGLGGLGALSIGVSVSTNFALKTSVSAGHSVGLLKKMKTLTKKEREKDPRNRRGSGDGPSMMNEKDQLFFKLFKIKGEIVVREMLCDMIKDKKKEIAGTLYISQNYFAFASDTFGSKTRQKFAIHKIAAVSKKEDAIHVEWSDKTVYIFAKFKDLDSADSIMTSIWKSKLADGSKAETGSFSSLNMEGLGQSKKEFKKAHQKMKPTEEDWALILKGARNQKLKKSDVIIKEGDKSRMIFQVSRGSVHIEKGGSQIATLDSKKYGGIFGELSFIQGKTASATVISDEDTALTIIEGYFLAILFQHYPFLAGRFYHYLASIIALRCINQESVFQNLFADEIKKRSQGVLSSAASITPTNGASSEGKSSDPASKADSEKQSEDKSAADAMSEATESTVDVIAPPAEPVKKSASVPKESRKEQENKGKDKEKGKEKETEKPKEVIPSPVASRNSALLQSTGIDGSTDSGQESESTRAQRAIKELEQLVQEDEESDEVESTDEREKREGEEAIRELERLAFSEEGPDKRQIQIMKELERQEREREKEKDNSERKSRSKKGLPSSMCNPPMSVEKSPSLTKEESRNGRMTSGSNGKKKRITDKSKSRGSLEENKIGDSTSSSEEDDVLALNRQASTFQPEATPAVVPSPADDESNVGFSAKPLRIMMIGLSGVGRSSLLQRLWKGANAPARPVSNSSRDETSDEFEFEGSKVTLISPSMSLQDSSYVSILSKFAPIDGCIIVYDITDRGSFHDLSFYWLAGHNGQLPTVICGNRIDEYRNREIADETIQTFATSHKIKAVTVSALTGQNVPELLRMLIALILKQDSSSSWLGAPPRLRSDSITKKRERSDSRLESLIKTVRSISGNSLKPTRRNTGTELQSPWVQMDDKGDGEKEGSGKEETSLIDFLAQDPPKKISSKEPPVLNMEDSKMDAKTFLMENSPRPPKSKKAPIKLKPLDSEDNSPSKPKADGASPSRSPSLASTFDSKKKHSHALKAKEKDGSKPPPPKRSATELFPGSLVKLAHTQNKQQSASSSALLPSSLEKSRSHRGATPPKAAVTRHYVPRAERATPRHDEDAETKPTELSESVGYEIISPSDTASDANKTTPVKAEKKDNINAKKKREKGDEERKNGKETKLSVSEPSQGELQPFATAAAADPNQASPSKSMSKVIHHKQQAGKEKKETATSPSSSKASLTPSRRSRTSTPHKSHSHHHKDTGAKSPSKSVSTSPKSSRKTAADAPKAVTPPKKSESTKKDPIQKGKSAKKRSEKSPEKGNGEEKAPSSPATNQSNGEAVKKARSHRSTPTKRTDSGPTRHVVL